MPLISEYGFCISVLPNSLIRLSSFLVESIISSGNNNRFALSFPIWMAFFFKDFIYLFILRERGKERERAGEKHQCVVTSPAPPTGDLAQSCALTGNWTGNPLVCRPRLNALSLTHILKKILFWDRGMEGGREREKHPCVVNSHASLTGDLACKPSMCPDWESNQQPFGSEAGTQSTEPHQPGPNDGIFN